MINLPKSVNILGTSYKLEVHSKEDDELFKKRGLRGYCNFGARLIVILDVYKENSKEIIDPDGWFKKILRHEITHAFLWESGLGNNAMAWEGPWPKNEEMIDWFAIQGPKIHKIWEKLGIND